MRWPIPMLLGLAAACAAPARPLAALPAAGPLCPLFEPDHSPTRPLAAGTVSGRDPAVRVHYCHPALRPMAERVLAHARHALKEETRRLGLPLPLPDGARGGGPEVDLYLVNLGRGGRAQACEEPEGPAATQSPGYVVIDYRTPEVHDFLASYVAHELNHLLQDALGRLTSAPFAEATAAYVDDLLYPGAAILPAMVADFQRAPQRPLYAHDDLSTYDYGAALFVAYLVQRHGPALLREVFAAGQPNHLPALDAALRRRGSDLQGAAAGFALARLRTGRYADDRVLPMAGRFPEVRAARAVSPYEFLDAPLAVPVEGAEAPQELGTAYLSIDLTTPLCGGLEAEVRADPGPAPATLAASLVSADHPAPLATARLGPGQRAVLRAAGTELRPGTRLWVVLANLGGGPPWVPAAKAADTAWGATVRLRVP